MVNWSDVVSVGIYGAYEVVRWNHKGFWVLVVDIRGSGFSALYITAAREWM